MTRPTRQIWRAAVLVMLSMLVMALAPATPAAAQSPSTARIEISANLGAQTGASTFAAANTLPSHGGEIETITVDHGVKTAPAFSVGAAFRLVPRFWVGVQYAMAEMKPGATLTAAIPHPILFDVPRTVEGSVNDVAHNEQNVHVALMYALPLDAVDVKVLGGPTFFKVKQDFVSGVAIDEAYPFDTATLASATTKQLSESAVGFNAGVDISRLLSSHVGIGALLRYSRADVQFDDTEVGQQTVKAGGFEVAGGVRLRF
jgi:hypothetical protein